MPHLSRRHFLASSLVLATTAELERAARALGFSQQPPVCRLTAEQEQGPYYIGSEPLRSDVTEGKPGIPLALRLGILDQKTCQPLAGLAVDIWSCDALGLYSGFTAQNPSGPGGPPPDSDPQHPDSRQPGSRPGPPPGGFGPPPDGAGPAHENTPTDKLTFLRGIQITDRQGIVHFTTIVPGFYMGRTNHIHFRVRTGVTPAGKTSASTAMPAGHVSHTGQVFFPEAVMADLMGQPPYSAHRIHRTTAQEDMVFTQQHGNLSVAALRPVRQGRGYSAELIAAIDPASTPQPVGPGGGGGGRGFGPPPEPAS